MAGKVLVALFCMYFLEILGKIIYVPQYSPWFQAQNYCRTHYTDLAFASNQKDQDIITEASSKHGVGWIGLYRDLNNASQWLWSGGGAVSYQNWMPDQPDNYCNTETVANIDRSGQWNDLSELYALPFYCIDLPVVRMKMSWEKALEHCRQNKTDLASFSSDIEFLLAMKELPQDNNGRMWVNLHYLGDRWLSVDRDLSQERVWYGGGSLDLCPGRNRCAVLNRDGELESWDCEDKMYFMCKRFI